MKKILALVLALVLCLGLAACSVSYGDGEGNLISAEQLSLYQKYDYLISCLENQDYISAAGYIEGLYYEYMATAPTAPTEATEDPALVSRYEDAMYYLENLENNYLDDPQNFYCWDSEDNYIEGAAALNWLYNELVDLGDFRDSADYIGNFSSVDDVLLSYSYTSVDHMGNESTSSYNTHWYDADGKLVKLYGIPQELEYIYTTSYDSYMYEYDANGRVSALKLGSTDRVYALFTPTYDANGLLTSYHVMTSDGTEFDLFYTYDSQGRLLSACKEDVSTYDSYTYTNSKKVIFTYNAQGQLTEKRYEYRDIYDYVDESRQDSNKLSEQRIFSYHFNGSTLTGMTETYQRIGYNSNYLGDGQYEYTPYISSTYTHEHTYTCDSQNRILEDVTVYGNYFDGDGNQTDKWNYVSSTRTYNYGNYWFYTPSN